MKREIDSAIDFDVATEVEKVVDAVKDEAEKIEVKVEDLIASVERGVSAFVKEHLRNSPVSQATAAWNHLQSGLPALVEHIVKEVKGL